MPVTILFQPRFSSLKPRHQPLPSQPLSTSVAATSPVCVCLTHEVFETQAAITMCRASVRKAAAGLRIFRVKMISKVLFFRAQRTTHTTCRRSFSASPTKPKHQVQCEESEDGSDAAKNYCSNVSRAPRELTTRKRGWR